MIKVKKLNKDAKVPEKAHDNDAGYDLFSSESVIIPTMERRVVKTGISLAMNAPESNQFTSYLRIAPRSGLSVKKGIDVFAGVIDIGYRGEIMICLFNSSKEDFEITKGDKIAQIIPTVIFKSEIKEVENLDDTSRGEKGFGSSGQ